MALLISIDEVIEEIKTYLTNNFLGSLDSQEFPLKEFSVKVVKGDSVMSHYECDVPEDRYRIAVFFDFEEKEIYDSDSRWFGFWERADKLGQEIIHEFEEKVDKAGYVFDYEWGLDEEVLCPQYNMCLVLYSKQSYHNNIEEPKEIAENQDKVLEYTSTINPMYLFRMNKKALEEPPLYDYYLYPYEDYYVIAVQNRDDDTDREYIDRSREGETSIDLLNRVVNRIVNHDYEETIVNVELWLCESLLVDIDSLSDYINKVDIKTYYKKHLTKE